MDKEMEKLYHKYRNLGLSMSVLKDLNRKLTTLDPITKEIIKLNNIDINAIIPKPAIAFDRIFLFTALLITSHPSIATSVQEAREKLHITEELWEYKKFYDEETDSWINTSLENMTKEMKRAVNIEIEIIFNGVGRNLPRQDWTNELVTYIFTGVLPVPIYSSESFQLVENISGSNISKRYPIIVIKRRIKKHELDQLIEFIRDHEQGLIQATQHLPSEPVKRLDVDLTKLAIGLWVYKNPDMKNDEIEKLFEKKEEDNENYFGEYSELTKNELPNFKSDALVYLNQLYPL